MFLEEKEVRLHLLSNHRSHLSCAQRHNKKTAAEANQVSLEQVKISLNTRQLGTAVMSQTKYLKRINILNVNYINWASIRKLIFEKDFRQETLVAIFQWMMMSIFGSMKIELRNHESISKCFVLGK